MENNLTYTMNGDYQIPDLKLTEQPEKPLGKYGRMRKDYLKEHRPVLWNSLLLSERLYPHLREIDEAANNRLEQMMPELMKSAGVTEALKASDPMKWVGHRTYLAEHQLREDRFLGLRFQRVHQPHPAHRVTGFQFLRDARYLHHAE